MLTLRRRLASWALALVFCQAVAVFAATLPSVCAAHHAAAGSDHDCCPAGSHPPGQCPRHAEKNRSCRMQCDAPHGAQLLITALGVLPPPLASTVTLTGGRFVTIPQPAAGPRASVPDSPPPRLS